jgi:hypothetical protein
LKPDADSPNFFEFERRLLTDKFALVPRRKNPRVSTSPKVLGIEVEDALELAEQTEV